MLLLVGGKCLTGQLLQFLLLLLTHHRVALQAMLGHHILAQPVLLMLRLRNLRDCIQQRVEKRHGKQLTFRLVHRRQAVLAQIGVLESSHILDIPSLAALSL